MRLACDVGGTFTDLVLEDDSGQLSLFKSPTTPDDPVIGLLTAIDHASGSIRCERRDLLRRTTSFVHGTTRAINAILTGTTARTAFLTTEGHRDILLLREGGRLDPYDNDQPFPRPYVPRALTFEVPERTGADGSIVRTLDEATVIAIAQRLRDHGVEAVGVCLLWSIANPLHELKVEDILKRELPTVPITLSHRLNPTIREYRRATSTCIDASLKPLMGAYLRSLADCLRQEGFAGRLLVVTSQGGMVDAADMAEAPIHGINSGPSMAPVAGRYLARIEADQDMVIVTDTGGTSFDVSLVRGDRIPWTRETWLGPRFRGHMTGFPSVDVKSVGAGGGSIARVDSDGLLQVGPDSAGAVPGPACYGRGGAAATVTDCALVLGYLDPAFFLGGAIRLDLAAARAAIERHLAGPLHLSAEEAAASAMAVATENMVAAIEEITVHQGIDPRRALLIGGGGAAGFNAVAIARRLGCRGLLIPAVGAALSAVGALISDLSVDRARVLFMRSSDFDIAAVNAMLAQLMREAEAFAAGPGAEAAEYRMEFLVEARYPQQTWEIEVPLRQARFAGAADVRRLVDDFHALHCELYGVDDPNSEIELVTWRVRANCRLKPPNGFTLADAALANLTRSRRDIYLRGSGRTPASVHRLVGLPPEQSIEGPVIVESDFTTILIDPGASAVRLPSGSLMITP